MKKSKLIVAIFVALAIGLFFAFDLDRFVSLEFFKSRQAAVEAYVHEGPVAAAAVFFLVYVAVTGLSLPGTAIMTLAAGALFGLLWATVIVSFASSIGATLAFLASRFVLRDRVQGRFGQKLGAINRGVEREGAFYLFALRHGAWGRFDVEIGGSRRVLSIVSAAVNLRSRLTGVATGDQAIFVTKKLFERIGGYPPIALMEDVALGKRLRAHARPACVRPPARTSVRRWEKHGVARTVLLMWRLRLWYWLGADPDKLALRYVENK